MKAQWARRFASRFARRSRPAWPILLLVLAGIAGCASSWLAEEFLVGVAIGMAASVALRVILNADPEE